MTEPIMNPSAPAAPAAPAFDTEAFQATQAIIYRVVAQLEEVKAKTKETKQSLANVFINDSELQQSTETAKKASDALKQRKQVLLQDPATKNLTAKLKELTEEERDLEDALTNHLVSYFQMTGTKSFNTPSGEEREFKLLAKLLPAK